MKRLRAEAPRVPFTKPDDLAEMNEVNDASRSVELFKRAIQLQDREVLTTKESGLSRSLRRHARHSRKDGPEWRRAPLLFEDLASSNHIERVSIERAEE